MIKAVSTYTCKSGGEEGKKSVIRTFKCHFQGRVELPEVCRCDN